MNGLADLLTRHIAERVPGDEVGLFLSGGVDSLTAGFAAMHAGKRVHGYTFHLNGTTNLDLQSAQHAVQEFGWEWTTVALPTDRATLERDFLRLAREYRLRLKTQYECVWPLLYTAPLVREPQAMSAISVDWFGLSRKAVMHYHVRKSHEAFNRYRMHGWNTPDDGSRQTWTRVLAGFGVEHVMPYLHPSVRDYMLARNWWELNGPWHTEKLELLRAFPDEFSRVVFRRHANFQLMAGIPELFEQLLDSPLNTRRRTRMMDLCRDYATQA